MGIGLIIGITVIFFGILGTMAFFAVKQLKKVDEAEGDSSIQNNIETAQEFLPFKNIKDGVIDMGGNNYRVIMKCPSINYNLRTDSEKDMIELSFQRFLNSLRFGITIFIQTRVMDNAERLEKIKEETEEITKVYPQLENYARNYYEEMKNLNKSIGNNKQKKKYIIVPYNEAASLEKLSEKEKYEYSIKEARQRGLLVADALSGTGIKPNILDTKGLAELIYSTYHRDNFRDYKNVVNGEFLSLVVDGESNPEENLTNDKRADWILYEAQMRLKNELVDKEIPDCLKKEYAEIVDNLEKLREEIGIE